MRVIQIACAMGLAALIGCGDDDEGGTTFDAPPSTQIDARPVDGGGGGFQQPTGTVAVNFTVDDSANKVYQDGDLQWKGSMLYDSTTRKITRDASWGGPWATLYDDGPWNAGGHEPIGSTAGDNKWGVTVFVTPPAASSDMYEYGLQDADYAAMPRGDGWIWGAPPNGMFNVAMGATAAITAPGKTFPKFGTTDIQIELDTNALSTVGAPYDTSVVGLKSSIWGFVVADVPKDGTGKATLTVSTVVGSGKTFPHSGLPPATSKPEFKFLLGPAASAKEYADATFKALTTGVKVRTKKSTETTFTDATIDFVGNNFVITVP